MFRTHTRYIKNNEPQSVHAQHILQNLQEYSTTTDTMPLLRPVHTVTMLFPYEQRFIQNYHHEGKLIPEQHGGESNQLLQLAFDASLTSRT
jgi:hypothetical protein